MVRVQNVSFNNSIKERDNHECKVCYRNSLNLEVHHIQSVNDYPKLQHDEHNVITLCGDCHKEFHKMHSNTHFDKQKFEDYVHNKKTSLILLGELTRVTRLYQEMNSLWDSNIIDLYNDLTYILWGAFRNERFNKKMSLPELQISHYYEEMHRRFISIIEHYQEVKEVFGTDGLDRFLNKKKLNELYGLKKEILTCEKHSESMKSYPNWYYHGGNVLERIDL